MARNDDLCTKGTDRFDIFSPKHPLLLRHFTGKRMRLIEKDIGSDHRLYGRDPGDRVPHQIPHAPDDLDLLALKFQFCAWKCFETVALRTGQVRIADDILPFVQFGLILMMIQCDDRLRCETLCFWEDP